MTRAISPSIKDYLTMQRNTNMLKILKKVRFCRFYRFLCKNAVPRLSPEQFLSFGTIPIKHYVSMDYKA